MTPSGRIDYLNPRKKRIARAEGGWGTFWSFISAVCRGSDPKTSSRI